ncbi:hypothetical protein TWF694_001393 [Orbilia ellipsospora]|uniref:tRNA(Ile)-lysidine synthetase n=1 Tax=Orbilia ellipsospora TaxID=2528407 RepID=A0AAV9XT29_9PEZI
MRPIKPRFPNLIARFSTATKRFASSSSPAKSTAESVTAKINPPSSRTETFPWNPKLTSKKVKADSKTEPLLPPAKSIPKGKWKTLRDTNQTEHPKKSNRIPQLSPDKYAHLLRSVINIAADQKHKDVEIPKRMALAVSGGIDSMALAFLTASLKSFDNEFSSTEFVAMIVDHKLRAGSDEEADKVAKMMDRLGIKSHRITLNLNPTSVEKTRIELWARRERYTALARACQEYDIKHILTGHHGNDQAETFLMRLIKDSGHSGLACMAPVAKIPECEKVYGADEIMVLRPFLGVFKDRLRETLHRHGIEWYEDPTNADGTLTVRNAIRRLITPPTCPADLPVCLSPPSLVSRAKHIQLQNTWAEENVEWFLSRCTLRHIRASGVIEAFIPQTLLKFPIKFIAMVLARLAEVISPLDRVEMPQMQNVAVNIANMISRTNSETRDGNHPSVTWGEESTEVIKRSGRVSEFKLRYGEPVQYFRSAQTENNIYWEATRCHRMGNRPPGVILLCHRQPYIRYTSKRMTDTPEVDIDPKNPNEWVLFDGRFWMRYLGDADEPLMERVESGRAKRVFITATRKEVMHRFEQPGMNMEDDLGKVAAKELKKRMKGDAPGKSRSILPVLCEEIKMDVKLWKVPYRIHGFPTFELGGKLMGPWDWKPKRELVVCGTVIGDVPMSWKDGKMAPISMYSK